MALSSWLTRILMSSYIVSAHSSTRLLLRSSIEIDSAGGRAWACGCCCGWPKNGNPPTCGLPPVVAIALLYTSLTSAAMSVAPAFWSGSTNVLSTAAESVRPPSMATASSFSMRSRSIGVDFTTMSALLLFSATTRMRPGVGAAAPPPPRPRSASGFSPPPPPPNSPPPPPGRPPCACACGPLKISVSSRAASSADTYFSGITLNRFSAFGSVGLMV